MAYWNNLTLQETEYGQVVYSAATGLSYEICDLSYRILRLLKEKNEEQLVLCRASAFKLSRPEMAEKLNQLRSVFCVVDQGYPQKRRGIQWVKEEALVGVQCILDTKGWSGTSAFLFNPIVFAPLVLLTLILLLKTILHYSLIYSIPLSASTFWILIFLAFSTLWHEIGHIQAARTYGLSRISIGAGMYYLFPVLFTDMTYAYLLNKTKRLTIGLSGIYFEWIYVLVLLIFAMLFKVDWMAQAGVFVFIKSLYNLNPFFRTDGYWVLSDYLQRHQLKDAAYRALGSVLRNRKFAFKSELLLSLYALFHFIFYLLFTSYLFRRVLVHFEELLLKQWTSFDWNSLKLVGIFTLELFAFFHLARLLLQAIYSLQKYLAGVTKN